MVENKSVLYAAIFITIVLTIIYIIFVVYNINKQKNGEVVNESTLDTMFWMGIVLSVAMALILIWIIAVFFMGDSAIVVAANVITDSSQGSTVRTVETVQRTATPYSQPLLSQQAVGPVSVTSNSVSSGTLNAILAAS